jgi:Adenylyl/Guanylyl and SMODS C-terminal sensor domain/Second Messenger Oligonucleotide or Dinucleotide Synthetase domain
MKLHAYFAGLLTDTVNLSRERLDLLDSRVSSIVACVKADEQLKDLYIDHIPQGSWPHRTIITPLPGKEFDADFLLHLQEVDEWTADPKEYIRQVRAAFKRSFVYKDMVRKKNRCVRIGYVNDCHVDVVPHLVLADGRQVIINYKDNQFEDTNPAGFTTWMHEKDDLANGYLRVVLRLLKYLRDYKKTFSVPSIILTTLLGERVQAWNADDLYPDLPTAFVNLLTALDTWLAWHPTMPTITDPSCPGTTFNHRWDEDKYTNFTKWIGYYRAKAEAALKEEDKDKSTTLWREIFGEAFAKSTTQAAAKEAVNLSGATLATKASVRLRRAPGEQFIEELGYPLRPAYAARINATVRDLNGFRRGTLLRAIRHTRKHMSIDFCLSTDCPEPYELWWKVRNTGEEATAAGCLRGKIVKDEGQRRRTETTAYRGTHYVEVYVVKNGIVVATDHHDVHIA